MFKQAVQCFEKIGDIESALNTCVLLSRWEDAMKIAETEGLVPRIEGLITKQVEAFLKKGHKLQAVELYRQINKPAEAAKLLAELAEEMGKKAGDPLTAKKLHILAAHEVERYRDKTMDLSGLSARGHGTVENSTATTLVTILHSDIDVQDNRSSSKVMDSAWRGAAAFHYFLLANKQVYGGDYEGAMKTAIRCSEFEDILDSFDIYSLIALASHKSNYFGVCSRAFVKMKSLPSLDDYISEYIHNLVSFVFLLFLK